MRSKQNLGKYEAHRSILSDMLPFETPPSFSNGGFFNFLKNYNIQLSREDGQFHVQWDCEDDSCNKLIEILFNSEAANNISEEVLEFQGNISTRKKSKLKSLAMRTQPFQFNISHKIKDSRQLSIIHPRNQLDVANFYYKNSALIRYYASLSPFSLRKPSNVAKSVFFDDKLHRKRLGDRTASREESHKEYQYLASFFTYEKYSNIYRFYESYQYHRAEKKFDRLLKLDISKCFDSIYTHSLPWAVLGKQATKDNLNSSKKTFSGRFDRLLQDMNLGETNGIVIGPEFSRVFAEIILQNVDIELQKRLLKKDKLRHKVDYEIFRYVDDFFIFHNSPDHADVIEAHLSSILREFKLNLNSQKTGIFEKPIITNLTIAKNKVKKLLADRIDNIYLEIQVPEAPDIVEVYAPKISANQLIVEFKTVLKDTKTEYHEILNYTFASIERAFKTLLSKYIKNIKELNQNKHSHLAKPQQFMDALIALLEFSFFIYSASQRVNFTVRLSRSISMIVDGLNEVSISQDLKHQVFKYAHDNMVRILKSNQIEEYKEIETLYLVLALKKLGRQYRVDSRTLARYFGISPENTTSVRLNHFSITVLLLYIRNISKYQELKVETERQIIEKFKQRKVYAQNDAELIMIYLDLITCPYVSDGTKNQIDAVFNVSPVQREVIRDINPYWFTNWRNFDLSLELDKKRARQVY